MDNALRAELYYKLKKDKITLQNLVLDLKISPREYETIVGEKFEDLPVGIAQTAKLKEIGTSCESTIKEGFTASNGRFYTFNDLDQMNFTQQMILVLNGDTSPIFWATDQGVMEHTTVEFLQVVQEAKDHKLLHQNRYWTLKQQVLSTTSLEEVEAIEW